MTRGQSSLTQQAKSDDTAFFGHPRGLSTLFFTEMWERFSYYGMRALLTLYLVSAPAIGALGYSNRLGGLVYGLYTGLVYALALPGGWIADRFIGQRKAVTWGAVLIIAGHVCLAIPIPISFFIGLALVSIGTGFLKPNVSTIVGQLYRDDDPRRDSGFSIYYMGINLGAWLGPLVLGFLAQSDTFLGWLEDFGISRKISWHVAFGASAIGMLFGLLQYLAGQHRLKDAGLRPTPPKDAAEAAGNRRLLVYIGFGIFGLPALVGILGALDVIELTRDRVDYGCLIALLLVAAGFFAAMFTKAKWTSGERKRIVAVMALFFGAVFFFSVFEQAGSTFTVFADQHTENSVFGFSFPSSWWQSVNSIFVISLSPVFAGVWAYLVRRGKNPPWPLKFGVGLILVALGCLAMLPAATTVAAGHKAGPSYLLVLYFLHTCGELCLSPVGLSSTSRVAPKQIAGLAMGVWFMGTGIGNYLSGMYLGWTESIPLFQLFIVMAIPPIAGGLVFLAIIRPLRRASES